MSPDPVCDAFLPGQAVNWDYIISFTQKEESFMEYGSMSIQRLQSGRWLNWGIRFFLTAALTASQTAGDYAPFALGCIAAMFGVMNRFHF